MNSAIPNTVKPIEFDGFGIGIWDSVFNPGFNDGEFAIIRSQAGLDRSRSNRESINSVLIRQGLPAPERLLRLNEIAITQMRTLLAEPNLKRLK